MRDGLIKKIVIQNFRCFKKTKISQLKRVNLIGGGNNIGKTVLLEALLLNYAPTVNNVLLLKRLRGFDIESQKKFPEYTWNDFFYNQQKQEPISITCAYDDDKEVILNIQCDESNEHVKSYYDKDNIIDLISVSTSTDKTLSTLYFNYLTNTEKYNALTLMFHNEGINVKEAKVVETLTKQVSYIPAYHHKTNASLVDEYGKADQMSKENLVLQALQIIDSTIVDIKISPVSGVHIEIKRKNKGFLSISLFGDAIKKVANIVLSLINNSSSILLIDEIENGIHHTAQEKFWSFIFKLSIEFNVQIFATSHSAEMITAFEQVCSNSEDNGAYIELRHNLRTGNIIGITHDSEVLDYELKHNKAYRGE